MIDVTNTGNAISDTVGVEGDASGACETYNYFGGLIYLLDRNNCFHMTFWGPCLADVLGEYADCKNKITVS